MSKNRQQLAQPRRFLWGTLLVVACLVGYVAARPYLEQRFGITLPSITSSDDAAPEAEPASTPAHDDAGEATIRVRKDRDQTGSQADRAEKSEDSARSEDGSDDARALGELVETSPGRFESMAGLLYTRGSREGHRIKHVMRHAEDQSGRPVHGVFDGGPDAVLAVIDEAFLKAEEGGRGVSRETQDENVVYTVDLGRRIGYVGGQSGKRRGRPKATKVRLVLDGNRVITAYPLGVIPLVRRFPGFFE
jgi:hypothetical protein